MGAAAWSWTAGAAAGAAAGWWPPPAPSRPPRLLPPCPLEGCLLLRPPQALGAPLGSPRRRRACRLTQTCWQASRPAVGGAEAACPARLRGSGVAAGAAVLGGGAAAWSRDAFVAGGSWGACSRHSGGLRAACPAAHGQRDLAGGCTLQIAHCTASRPAHLPAPWLLVLLRGPRLRRPTRGASSAAMSGVACCCSCAPSWQLCRLCCARSCCGRSCLPVGQHLAWESCCSGVVLLVLIPRHQHQHHHHRQQQQQQRCCRPSPSCSRVPGC
jgi:hypothetical protein